MRIRVGLAVLTMLGAGAVAASPPAAAAPTHALIQGSGSSWAANAVNQWIADVSQSGLQVVYTGSGSAQGRRDFANDVTDFAVSDLPFGGTDPATGASDTAQGRAFRYVPLVAGGTSFPYHLDVGGSRVRDLRLSGPTLAGIFTGSITRWNDTHIRADNNGRVLPKLRIVPVVHDEGSAVSYRVSEYLAHVTPTTWRRFAGSAAPTAFWPRLRGAPTESGSDGVANFVSSSAANGAIGMNEYTYALAKNVPVAKVRNHAGAYVAPQALNVALALRRAVPNPTGPANLSRVFTDPDPRSYPLSSYGVGIVPTGSTDPRITTAKRQTLVEFVHYSVCQGQRTQSPLGYAPLPLNLTRAALDVIPALHAADADVDVSGRDVSTCDNPTFERGTTPKDRLGTTVPQPATCDRSGHGPCLQAGSHYRTTLTLAGRATVRAGAAHRLTGTLRASGIPVERGIVAIYGAVRGGTWKRIDTVRADSHGVLHVSVRPARTSRYQARFGGTSHFAKATSGQVVVTVPTR